MSKKEKEVELAVVNGKWKMKHGNNSGDSEGTYPVLDFAAQPGPHLITFKLPAGGQNRFSATDPIWVSDNQKPTTVENHEQISDWAVFDRGTTLVVLNKNSEEGTLYYRLNIEGPGGALDPEIKNGGEGVVPPPPPAPGYGLIDSNASLAIALLIAVAVGVAIALLFRR